MRTALNAVAALLLAFACIFTAPAASSATLTVSPTTVTAGGTVTLTWSGIATPTPLDWIPLYPSLADDTAWWYSANTTGTASGSIQYQLASHLRPGPTIFG